MSTVSGFVFLNVLILLASMTETKKILLVPVQLTSLVLEMNSVASGLLEKGHEVYVTIGSDFPAKAKIAKSIKILEFQSNPNGETSDMIISRMFSHTRKELGHNVSQQFHMDCTALMDDSHHMNLLRKMEFDLALANGHLFSYCPLLVPYILKVPYVFMFSSPHPWQMGVPALPSFVPLVNANSLFSDKMTFVQRLQNTFYYIMFQAFKPFISFHDKTLLHKYAPEISSWEDLAYKSDLFLVPRDHLLEWPAPSMPNVITTPGITVNPPKPLPADLDAIVRTAPHGVVLVSFGSLASNFPQKYVDKLVEAFNQLTETVIWRFAGDAESVKGKVKENVHLLSWLPQNDILGHPNVKVFVTHCGNNGQYEALYHAMPMVGLPVFAEQFHNAHRMHSKGFGLSILPSGISDFTVNELVHAIQEVTKNSTYRENIEKASRILKDNPMTPTETATYWLEHIMKFGSGHLRSHALDMPWYELFMIDILVFFIVITLLVVFIIKVTLSKVIKIFETKSKKDKVE